MDPSPPHLQERLHWERQEAAVRRRRDQLQVHFQGLVQQLEEGRPLETPPGSEILSGLDHLPKIPTVSGVRGAAPSHSLEKIEFQGFPAENLLVKVVGVSVRVSFNSLGRRLSCEVLWETLFLQCSVFKRGLKCRIITRRCYSPGTLVNINRSYRLRFSRS